jgi:hypothetical protein
MPHLGDPNLADELFDATRLTAEEQRNVDAMHRWLDL